MTGPSGFDIGDRETEEEIVVVPESQPVPSPMPVEAPVEEPVPA